MPDILLKIVSLFFTVGGSGWLWRKWRMTRSELLIEATKKHREEMERAAALRIEAARIGEDDPGAAAELEKGIALAKQDADNTLRNAAINQTWKSSTTRNTGYVSLIGAIVSFYLAILVPKIGLYAGGVGGILLLISGLVFFVGRDAYRTGRLKTIDEQRKALDSNQPQSLPPTPPTE